VQPVALASQREELHAILAGEHAQPDLRAGRRLGRDDVRRTDDVIRTAAEAGSFHASEIKQHR
jgi:hypothetical protein